VGISGAIVAEILVRYVGISAIPRGKVRRASGPVERCPLCGKFPETPPIGHNPSGEAKQDSKKASNSGRS
jgi:hypothetical protein